MLFVLVCFAPDSEGEDRILSPDGKAADFNRVIRPILAKHCLSCHGRDNASRQADLRLDERDTAIASGAIVSGHPDASELVKRIESSDPDLVMPPPDSENPVSESDRKALVRWIAEGAIYAEHWSFTSLIRPPLPTSNGWSSRPVDRFVYEKLKSENLVPNEIAEPWVLLRRVSLDLTGLPPDRNVTEMFLANPTEQSYEKAVDHLLGSDSYGEHWARMWLDLARYADTKGYEKDRERVIWRYRDWVIDAFNADLPYDEFTIQQLAGDLLPNATMEQKLATAFHRNTMENDEGGTDDEEFRVAAVKDRVDTTMQVWMGLTAGCAKCHAHKYDPISQKEYYQLYAFFNQTADADRGQPMMKSPTVIQQKELSGLEVELRTLENEYTQVDPVSDQAYEGWIKQFDSEPLWKHLELRDFTSESNVKLEQVQAGHYNVAGELPEKDIWVLTMGVTDSREITSLRLDTLPKPQGGRWPDKNVALREMKVEKVDAAGQATPIKLVNPRADFSQRGWEVQQAIDRKPEAGWAFSPNASQPHCAIFDLEEPIQFAVGEALRFTLEQQYGQGLVLDEFKLSCSSYPVSWLKGDVKALDNLRELYRKEIDPRTQRIAKAIDGKRSKIRSLQNRIPSTPVMQELGKAEQRETKIHLRGNFLDLGESVTPQVPAQFGTFPEDAPLTRLGVAGWLLQDSNPLTARVAVNRFWARLFGRGLVETEEDFGTQGKMPTHPELLDWLASDFRGHNWSIKSLLKTIVMSKTYRQSSKHSDEKLSLDPRNELLSRGPRFRMSAEMVRDQSLAVSGLLTQRVGGPSVMPPQPPGIWKSTYSGEKWKNATGPDRYRRALYTYKKRTSPYPAMTTFDSSSGEVCQIRRIRTNTPLQALVTLNDVAFFEAAGGLAKRMTESSPVLRQQLSNGFQMTLVRRPDKSELERLVELYETLEFNESNGKKILNAAGLEQGDP
ncbi:MAG: PSD1 and planctomycete cytochrome C domain-containing protein, partial [Planctomycetota bacterium]|nr:PSD1 and planctomycete cytochrome C domain-containing protein [Planctomycetota bacterium]